MAAPTHYYVSPASGDDTTGDGSKATPWKTTQKALDTIVRNATDGDQINLQAGAADVLTAPLDIDGGGKYGSPTVTAPLIFRGYTTNENDGGIGDLDGGGTVSIIADVVVNAVKLIDLHLHNGGSATIVDLNDDCLAENCEVDGTTSSGLSFDDRATVVGCHLHNIGNAGVRVLGGFLAFNFFKNGANLFTVAILDLGSVTLAIVHNVISIGGSSDGINFRSDTSILGNTIYSAGGTGQGISPTGPGRCAAILLNNVIEGFSGAGGKGIEVSADDDVDVYGGNAVYNCATNYDIAGDVWVDLGGNETLTASPFANPGGDDFSVSAIVRGSAKPASFKGAATDQFLDKGAAQRKEYARILAGLRTGGRM